MNAAVQFVRHARDRWQHRAGILGLDDSIEALRSTFRKAVPERPRNRAVRWNLFKRSVAHGAANYLVSDGWRFVVVDGRCVNVERILPHENFRR